MGLRRSANAGPIFVSTISQRYSSLVITSIYLFYSFSKYNNISHGNSIPRRHVVLFSC